MFSFPFKGRDDCSVENIDDALHGESTARSTRVVSGDIELSISLLLSGSCYIRGRKEKRGKMMAGINYSITGRGISRTFKMAHLLHEQLHYDVIRM